MRSSRAVHALLLLVGLPFLPGAGCRLLPPATDTGGAGQLDSAGPDEGSGSGDEGSGSGSETGDTDDTGDWEFVVEDGRVGTVIVLVTDGVRMEETLGEGVSPIYGEATEDFWPSIREDLLPQGTRFFPAYATGPTITAEGHAAMLTGARVQQATFGTATDDDGQPEDGAVGMYRSELPTLFELMRRGEGLVDVPAEALPLDLGTVGLVSNSIHLASHDWSLVPGLGEDLGAELEFLTAPGEPVQDPPTIDAVKNHLDTHGDTRFIIANLHQADRAGHNVVYRVTEDEDGEEVIDDRRNGFTGKVSEVDDPIVELWEWVQADPRYADDTVLVIVSDHGRHRYEDGLDASGLPVDFQHHSDQCVGCRQIPMLMLGAGIKEIDTVTDPYTLEDLGHTLGWLLGAEMPWAEGQIITEALVDPPEDNGRVGEALPAISGSLEAQQIWGDEPRAKTTVEADGEQLSTPSALHAEDPVAWSNGDREVACFRELIIDPDATFDFIGDWFWQGRCFGRDAESADWSDLDFPDDAVQPYFRPALQGDDEGALWLAYADSPMANWEGIYQDLRLLRWTSEEGWQGVDQGETDVYLPTDPALALADDTAFIAVTTSERNEGRHNRHVRVYTVPTGSPDTQEWTRSFQVDTTWHDSSAELARMERPALVAVDGAVHLAFPGYRPDTTPIIQRATATWEDEAWTWSDPETVDSTGRVLGIQRPVFSEGGTLAWARLVSGKVQLCTLGIDESVGAELCEDTGATAVRGLAFRGETLVAGLRNPGGAWIVRSASE